MARTNKKPSIRTHWATSQKIYLSRVIPRAHVRALLGVGLPGAQH